MGKDREGKFHPKKGKPSGNGKEEGVGLNPPHTGSHEEYIEMADKYTEGADEMPAVAIRHPNRNVNKGEEERNSTRQSYKSKSETFSDDRSPAVPEELPGVLTKELFASLAGHKADICISAYIPTHRAGVEVNEQEDIIRFKNVLQNLSASLKHEGHNQTTIQKLLEPGYELVRNDVFWKYMNHGLAFFISEGMFKYVKMGDTPREEVHINKSFLLKPLVNAMTVSEYFYLLVVSKKQVKFYKADAFGMQHVEIAELPNGVDDVVRFEEKDSQKLFRSESGQAGKGANFHGQGGGKPDEKENIAIYLEEVDDTLYKEVLNRENVPLLLAGVEYLLPIYKSVTDYNHVWDDVITGSHEHDDLLSLYTKAREVMEPYFQQRTKRALSNYGNQSATALTSSIPADVVSAAHYGRIWHLFVRERQGDHIWGSFDEMENRLTVHEEKQEGDECLIDRAVIKTILNGGDVHFLSDEDMPADSPVAALMRY